MNQETTPLRAPLAFNAGEVKVDLYPSGVRGAPTVIYLHGGGWVAGSRSDHPERLSGLAQQGLTVASVDYRLAHEAAYPAQREDIESVATKLIAEGIARSGEIVLMGASAGAHLAVLAAAGGLEWCAAVIALFGRYDYTSRGDVLTPLQGLQVPLEIENDLGRTGLERQGLRGRLALLTGHSESHLNDEHLRQISPVNQLGPKCPPLLLLHGTRDAVVSHEHTRRLGERAHELGLDYELLLLEGANHEDPLFADKDVLVDIARFIARSLHAEGRPVAWRK